MEIVKMNINVGGGLINHLVIKEDKVYRFVEDGLMIYKYNHEDVDTLIDKILEQEYDDNFVGISEYDINTFDEVNEQNIYSIIEECNIKN